MRPMSWLPKKVASEYALVLGVVYKSSALNRVIKSAAPPPAFANRDTLAWNGKSKTLGNFCSVTKLARNGISESATSPKIGKFFLPAAFAVAKTLGKNAFQNSGLTCFAVSIRNPSISNRVIQLDQRSDIPLTTAGFSVKMSSSPEKSPSVTDVPDQIESPRLW